MAYTLAPPLAAYVYQQYSDSDEVSAFFIALNNLCQSDYVDFFNTTDLAIYTEDTISGALLDWTAQGIYGMTRPIIPTGNAYDLGAYNTIVYNGDPFNFSANSGQVSYVQLSDDFFKRCMTWNFYKGDGNNFSFTWLKKRVARWLNGVNGTAPLIDQTHAISVNDIGNRTIQIVINTSKVLITAGAYGNTFLGNVELPNYYATASQTFPINFTAALAQTLQMLIKAQILQLPFMYTFEVVVQ